MTTTTRHYAGADWLKGIGKPVSPLGERAADLLGWVFCGLYHIEQEVLKVDWSNERWIEIKLPGTLATYDAGTLTRLVVGAHDRALRVQVSPSSRQYLMLMIHPRQREGRIFEQHPTIELALARMNDREIVP